MDVQAGFRKGRGTRDQIANICWMIEKTREFMKTPASPSLTALEPLTVWITTNWKILKETGIRDHFTHLLRNLYAGKKQQLELDMKQWNGSKVKKEYKVVYYHPAYLTYMHHVKCWAG